MDNAQRESIFRLASEQLKDTEYEKDWDNYVEGVTDVLWSLGKLNDMSAVETRLWHMWECKVREGMI